MLPASSPFKTFLNYRNSLLMLYKNLPRTQRKRILRIRMTLDGLSAINSLLKGDMQTIKAIWKAHNDYRKLRRGYNSSGNIDKPLSYPSCVYHRSIVYQYFIKGRKVFGNLPTILLKKRENK